MSENDDLEDFLNQYPAEVRELVLESRRAILAIIPSAIEEVDARSRVIGYGF